MPSAALGNLFAGLAEVDALQRANPTPQQGGGFTRPEIVRAIGRAEVILLSSHFERYIYDVNEEATSWLIASGVIAKTLSDTIRLLHSRTPVDALAATQWDNRIGQLRQYTEREARLWDDQQPVELLDPERLLEWMKSPHCKELVRYFKMWNIPDIFSAITRTNVNRGRLWLRISDLVDKRNNIAHGDLTEEARYLDIQQYKAAVRRFCSSADKAMARALANMANLPRPW